MQTFWFNSRLRREDGEFLDVGHVTQVAAERLVRRMICTEAGGDTRTAGQHLIRRRSSSCPLSLRGASCWETLDNKYVPFCFIALTLNFNVCVHDSHPRRPHPRHMVTADKMAAVRVGEGLLWSPAAAAAVRCFSYLASDHLNAPPLSCHRFSSFSVDLCGFLRQRIFVKILIKTFS